MGVTVANMCVLYYFHTPGGEQKEGGLWRDWRDRMGLDLKRRHSLPASHNTSCPSLPSLYLCSPYALPCTTACIHALCLTCTHVCICICICIYMLFFMPCLCSYTCTHTCILFAYMHASYLPYTCMYMPAPHLVCNMPATTPTITCTYISYYALCLVYVYNIPSFILAI